VIAILIIAWIVVSVDVCVMDIKKKTRTPAIRNKSSWYNLDKNVPYPDNQEIVEADPHLLRIQIDSQKRKTESALHSFLIKRQKLQQLELLLETRERVTEVIDGVAVCHNFNKEFPAGNEHYCIGATTRIYRDGKREYGRSAKIYRNQHNKKTWGIHLYDFNLSIHSWNREKWIGANFIELEECQQLVKEWVTTGNYDTSALKVQPRKKQT